ncbi:MAG: hypothetical protein AAGA99_11170 [Actinomycetota bacterium]
MFPEQAAKFAALVLGSAIVGFVSTHLILITLVERDNGAHFEDTAVAWGLGHEYNAPSAFAAGLVLLAAVLCAIAARRSQMFADPNQRGWTVLAVVLAFIAVDEAVQIHERLGERLDDQLDLGGPLAFPWIVPYLAATFVLFLTLRPFLGRLDETLRRRLMIAGVIYVGGAAGVESIAAARFDSQGDQADYVYHLISTVEEAMELTGMTIFVVAMIAYLTVRPVVEAPSEPEVPAPTG